MQRSQTRCHLPFLPVIYGNQISAFSLSNSAEWLQQIHSERESVTSYYYRLSWPVESPPPPPAKGLYLSSRVAKYRTIATYSIATNINIPKAIIFYQRAKGDTVKSLCNNTLRHFFEGWGASLARFPSLQRSN